MKASEIPIESPCGADWRSMKPSDKKRFCDTCRKHVHDLSSMTAGEARAVLASPPTEGLCVRYLYDAHGDVVFRDAPLAPSMLVRTKRLAVAAAAIALPMALTGCMGAMEVRPQPMMGAPVCTVRPPEPTPTPAIEKMGEVPSAPLAAPDPSAK